MAIRIADKTPDKESEKQVMATNFTPDGKGILGSKQVGTVLDDVRQEARDNLRRLEEPNMFPYGTGDTSFPQPVAHQALRSDGTPFPQTVRTTSIAMGPLATTLTKEQTERLLTVGGERCDYCNKTRQKLDKKIS